MSEMNIDKAMPIWMKRLADNCVDRNAIGCRNILSISEQCNILDCPRILNEAHLKRVFRYIDLKSEGKKDE